MASHVEPVACLLIRFFASLTVERLVVNITSEIYFVIQLLTAKGPNLAGSQVSDGRSVQLCILLSCGIIHCG